MGVSKTSGIVRTRKRDLMRRGFINVPSNEVEEVQKRVYNGEFLRMGVVG